MSLVCRGLFCVSFMGVMDKLDLLIVHIVLLGPVS